MNIADMFDFHIKDNKGGFGINGCLAVNYE